MLAVVTGGPLESGVPPPPRREFKLVLVAFHTEIEIEVVQVLLDEERHVVLVHRAHLVQDVEHVMVLVSGPMRLPAHRGCGIFGDVHVSCCAAAEEVHVRQAWFDRLGSLSGGCRR
jgi:hypothetical protein